MTMPRSTYVKEGQQGIYHCFSRCVRRAFLCGVDRITGRDLSHRKQWLLERLRFLATVFSIDVCAYAIMQNHYHLVIRTRPDLVEGLSNQEVAARWLILSPRSRLTRDPDQPTENEINALAGQLDRIAQLRRRLSSVSWFMAKINEFIARSANKEDEVKGRFWEGRFKCQVLLDEAAVAAAMVYVDLNPIRSKSAETPEESDFTSIQDRIRAWQQETAGGNDTPRVSPNTSNSASIKGLSPLSPPMMERLMPSLYGTADSDWLCPLQSSMNRRGILPCTDSEYFKLVDESGRMMRPNKRGSIDPRLAPVLLRIGANPRKWGETVTSFGSEFYLAGGEPGNLQDFASHLGQNWLKGIRASRRIFSK